MSESSVNERFKILIKAIGVTPYMFAKKIGVTPSGVYGIIRGQMHKPGFDVLEATCKIFNVNGDWLLTGRGEMFFGNNS